MIFRVFSRSLSLLVRTAMEDSEWLWQGKKVRKVREFPYSTEWKWVIRIGWDGACDISNFDISMDGCKSICFNFILITRDSTQTNRLSKSNLNPNRFYVSYRVKNWPNLNLITRQLNCQTIIYKSKIIINVDVNISVLWRILLFMKRDYRVWMEEELNGYR